MSFPVFKNIERTLQNWSIKLNSRLSRLEDSVGAFLLNAEIETAKTWVDGKRIYRKTFFVESLPNTTTVNFDHNIQYSQVVDIYGIATNGEATLRLPRATPTAGDSISVIVVTEKLRITTGDDRSAYSGYIHVEYTK